VLPPGSRINEGQVGASLGVSRTPLREAIKTLVSEGLVELLPAKGAIVRHFGEQDVFHILEVLKSLEQTAARLLCTQAADAELDALSALHDEMMMLYGRRDRLAYFKCNQSIHSGLVRASGNPVLAEMHEQLQSRIKRVRFVGNDRPDRWAGAVAPYLPDEPLCVLTTIRVHNAATCAQGLSQFVVQCGMRVLATALAARVQQAAAPRLLFAVPRRLPARPRHWRWRPAENRPKRPATWRWPPIPAAPP
jgi:DNA-binding GntR family transcriptional regulator